MNKEWKASEAQEKKCIEMLEEIARDEKQKPGMRIEAAKLAAAFEVMKKEREVKRDDAN